MTGRTNMELFENVPPTFKIEKIYAFEEQLYEVDEIVAVRYITGQVIRNTAKYTMFKVESVSIVGQCTTKNSRVKVGDIIKRQTEKIFLKGKPNPINSF